MGVVAEALAFMSWTGSFFFFFKKNLLKEPDVLGLQGFSWTLLASEVFISDLEFKAEVLPQLWPRWTFSFAMKTPIP